MKYDVAIIGSGFAGSILAWILAKRGRRVALIDSIQHPRFAIGESSTPIADMLLRHLGEKHSISQLVDLATYGTWQRRQSGIACGKKRGFSYYRHRPNEPFADCDRHSNSLLVAASPSDELSDTHWYRTETDQYFFNSAIDQGAADLSGHHVTQVTLGDANQVSFSNQPAIHCDYLIDASGSSCVTGRLLGAADRTGELRTNTHSIFAHYRDVASWSAIHGSDDDPFDGDDAAQHHLMVDGWLWMLRFNNGITSVGLTTGIDSRFNFPFTDYPSIAKMFDAASIVGPSDTLITTGRLQRFFEPVLSRRCWMLPTAAVTIDPLHSTGIAHALAGVDRSVDLILSGAKAESVNAYGKTVCEEAKSLDRLVHCAYKSINDFPRFTAACMLYFAGAIVCEERFQAGDRPSHLWNFDDPSFIKIVDDYANQFPQLSSTPQLVDRLRRDIKPWNTAGLLDHCVRNRYAYTATKS